jgi:hypothetical protein
MYISIGTACDVKYNIDKYIGSKHTLFFDWLMADMTSVNKVIGCENIDKILFFENIIQNIENPIHSNHSRIDIKSLSFCQSIHDIPIVYNSSHINDFISKYKRRFNRIIESIKHDTSVIYFIRKGEITTDEKNTFINNILKINSNCNFKLVELQNKDTNNSFIKEKHFISVNLENYRIKPVSTSWVSNEWNWKQIFHDISK